jgi:uncharacterized RDD family membrane protein YckC
MDYQIPIYAGFWKRFLAYILDQIILSFVHLILIIPVFIIFGLSFLPHGIFDRMHEYGFTIVSFQVYDNDLAIAGAIFFIFVIMILGLLILVIEWLYYALFESSKNQATLGKIIVGIVVTDLDGKRISFARASGRFFGKIISGLILNIGYIIAGFTEKKQALHDIIASCLVVNKNALTINQYQNQDENLRNL